MGCAIEMAELGHVSGWAWAIYDYERTDIILLHGSIMDRDFTAFILGRLGLDWIGLDVWH